jgi:hypothetical protein
MKRLHALMAALLVLASASATGQTTDRKTPAARIAGTWQVAYEDLALGEIDGTATISPDGKSASVRFRHDYTDYTLTSQSVIEQGDDYTIVLTGDSPAAKSLLPDAQVQLEANRADNNSITTALNVALLGKGPPSSAQPFLSLPPRPAALSPVAPLFKTAPQPADLAPEVHIPVPDDATKITVSAGDFHGEADFLARHPVETGRVELRLHFYKNGGPGANTGVIADRLTGTWHFYADPLTWRDAAGKGRVGLFRRDEHNPNFATQSGAEIWLRPVPPARMQFFAVGVFDFKRISRLYLGVPTVVEAVFDEPQARDTCPIEVESLVLTAHRDPENWRRFVSDPFVPGSDSP